MWQDIEFLKQRVRQLISKYESLATEQGDVELLIDDERMRYMALRVGWVGHKRIHLCLVHINICDEQVVIQCNNTEDLLIDELEEIGILRQQICSGFLPPEMRALVEEREAQSELEAV